MSSHSNAQVITLGTAGGPKVWTGAGSTANASNPASAAGAAVADNTEPRCGIATAIVVGEKWYLVDCGQSVFRQIKKAGLDMNKLGGIFITHLHSDHTVDLGNVFTLGLYDLANPNARIPVIGPGDRQVLPPLSPRATAPVEPAFPDNPVPGIKQTVEYTLRSFATDINDRVIDSLRPNPATISVGQDIILPTEIGFHANDNAHPDMEPFEIFNDGNVSVTATLVIHPPIAPAFAFRFNFPGGSVTISGDTRYSENLGRLAADTDLLLHEAIEMDWAYRINDINTEMGRAVIDHHLKSHTPPEDAGKIATEAGAKRLALHHLVPGNASSDVWQRTRQTFTGPLDIPRDNQVFEL